MAWLVGAGTLVGVVLIARAPTRAGVPGRAVVADGDGDGIADRADRCPQMAGVPPDGCPPSDRDGDQVGDAVDGCPDQPGPRENHGCPDRDRDGDGVADRVDGCPDDYGRVDYGGCPAPDRDGDGLADVDDHCPDRAEVWNGVRDRDGCPDSARSPLELRDRRIRFRPPLRFRDDETGLTTASGRAFKLAAALLVASRTPRIEVSVVADYGRSYGDSLQHARRRALVIERWLTAMRDLRRVAIAVVARPPDGDPRVEIRYY